MDKLNNDGELEKLKAILNDRLLFDPFSVNDEQLLSLILQNYNSQLHGYHFMIVRFGKIYEDASNPRYKPHKRIKIYYSNKSGSKNLNDFSFPIINENNKKQYNCIIDPYKLRNNVTLLNHREPEIFLEDNTFFLIRSIRGKNTFGAIKYIWTLINLGNNININSAIIREYIIKGQIWAYKDIISHPLKYNLNLSSEKLSNLLNPHIKKNNNIILLKKDSFVTKEEEEEDYDYDSSDDEYYYNDLEAEINYIRSNGGDWIDD